MPAATTCSATTSVEQSRATTSADGRASGPQRRQHQGHGRRAEQHLEQHHGAGDEGEPRARPAGCRATGRRGRRGTRCSPRRAARHRRPPGPGGSVSIRHSRSPARATAPGISASTISPRRSGTERQTAARSMRSIISEVRAGVDRAGWRPDSSRSSSRIGRCSAQRAGQRTRPRRPRGTIASRTSDPGRPGAPAAVLGVEDAARRIRAVGLRSSSGRERAGHDQGDRRRRRGGPPSSAEDRDAVRAAAYALGDPADHLREGGRGHDPQQQRDARRPRPGRGRGRRT